jgi:hypothetical protein
MISESQCCAAGEPNCFIQQAPATMPWFLPANQNENQEPEAAA